MAKFVKTNEGDPGIFGLRPSTNDIPQSIVDQIQARIYPDSRPVTPVAEPLTRGLAEGSYVDAGATAARQRAQALTPYQRRFLEGELAGRGLPAHHLGDVRLFPGLTIVQTA